MLNDNRSDHKYYLYHVKCSKLSNNRVVDKLARYLERPDQRGLGGWDSEWETVVNSSRAVIARFACADGKSLEISNDGSVYNPSKNKKLKLDKRVCGLN